MKRWFANLRLAYKLALGFGTTISLMVVIICVALNGMGGVKFQLNFLATRTLSAEEAVMRFSYAASRARILQYRLAGTKGEVARKLDSQITEFQGKADEALNNYGSLVIEPEDRTNFDHVSKAWESYKAIWTRIRPEVLSSDAKEAFRLFDSNTVDVYVNQLSPDTDKLIEWRVAAGKKKGQEGLAVAESSSKTVLVTGFAAVLVAGLFGLVMTRAMRRPLLLVAERLNAITNNCLAGLTQGLQAFARGDLRVEAISTAKPVPDVSNDEVGQMAATFNQALDKLQSSIACYNEARSSLTGIVRILDENSKSVAETSQGLAASAEESGAASGEIASGSEKLARDATNVAAVMQELASLISNVRDGIRQRSNTLAESAEGMASAAQEGNAAVSRTVSAMEGVQTKVEDAALKVQELDEKGQEIGRIVASIQDIAGQTNLLALNAAIEAARAGEHGRGFAVVADEVRKLAEKAALATQDISELIGSITVTVEETVRAIEATKEEVEVGGKTSEEAGEALTRILSVSAQVAAQAGEMASESDKLCEEMAAGANDVVSSISNVAAVSEESAAGAQELSAGIEEVGAAATELSSMSDQLRGVVAQFQIEDAPSRGLKLAA